VCVGGRWCVVDVVEIKASTCYAVEGVGVGNARTAYMRKHPAQEMLHTGPSSTTQRPSAPRLWRLLHQYMFDQYRP